MKRRAFLSVLGGAAVAWPLAARAQQRAMPTIGWLGSTPSQPDRLASFLDGLKTEGYVENENVALRARWADGHYDRLPALAMEFVQQRVDLIAAITTVSALAAKAATNLIPTVFLVGGDPVQLGLVASMNRPEANRTGVSLITHTLDAKRLELIRELIPTATTIGVLLNPSNPSAATNKMDVEAAARVLGMQTLIVDVGGRQALDPAYATLAAHRVDAVLVGADSLLNSLGPSIIELSAKHRFPAVYEWREQTQTGALMSYGTDIADIFRQAGVYSGRILRGAKPSDLPILQPSKFELAINLKTAKALGLTVPPALIARADEVIE